MDGLQSGEGRMMIDSVVWAPCINVTDTQTNRQTDMSPEQTPGQRGMRLAAIKWVRTESKVATNGKPA